LRWSVNAVVAAAATEPVTLALWRRVVEAAIAITPATTNATTSADTVVAHLARRRSDRSFKAPSGFISL
jgi:hypothetical protein